MFYTGIDYYMSFSHLTTMDNKGEIIGQRLKVLGLEYLEPGKNYLIVSDYPGSYAGFALMNVLPGALILVHSFLSRVPLVGFLLKSTGATFVQQKRFGIILSRMDIRQGMLMRQ